MRFVRPPAEGIILSILFIVFPVMTSTWDCRVAPTDTFLSRVVTGARFTSSTAR